MRKSARWFAESHSDAWEQFCLDVRQDPEVQMPFDEFVAEELAQSEEHLNAGASLFRARAGFTLDENGERLAWSGEAIAAPPAIRAKAGRGQFVLYVADQEKTAVSEVRPALGFYVSVAPITLNRNVRVLDLTKLLEALNPFIQESIDWHLGIRSLLNRLGEEMSRPLERDDDRSFYLPCQRLADFIRENGFDGMRYPSALNPGGSSVVFFDPGIGTVGESKLVKITEINVAYEVDAEPRFKDAIQALAEIHNVSNEKS